MHDQNMWRLFEQTGMINDYLNYKNSEKESDGKKEQTGESSYGTGYHSDRNDIIGGTSGRI